MARLVDHNSGWGGNKVFVDEHAYKFLAKSSLEFGDIVIANVGANAGTVFRIPLLEKPVTLGPNAVRVRPRSVGEDALVDQSFLYYYLSSPVGQNKLKSIISGSAQPKFNKTDLRALRIDLPPLSHQLAIAQLMQALDDRITLLRETNATLEAIGRSLFQSWFIDFDPVRAKSEGREPEGLEADIAELFPNELEESESRLIPKGWQVRSIADVTSRIFSGGTPDTRNPEFWNGHLPWFSSGETRKQIIIDCEKRITTSAVGNSSTKLACPGDILIASAGQGHTRGQTSYCAIDTYINQSVVSVRANEKICPSLWLFHNLSRRYDEMRNLSDSHSSRGSLTTKLLGGMHILLPAFAVIKAFTDIVTPLMTAQINNARMETTLSNLRDALLPRLISGQLRLPETEGLLQDAA
jgi:type I restriction enzyme S subunit